jgi:c-di-GMP-binding flagellar brake protein YcgR
MDDMTNVERRKLFRIEVVTPVRFRVIEQKTSKPLTDWMNGDTEDLSLGGMKIVAPMPESQVEEVFDQYVLLELSCKLPDTPKAFTATAAIAYFLHGATNLKATAVTFGLSFVSIDSGAKDTIGNFIRRSIGDS